MRCQRPLSFQSAAWSTLYTGEISYFSLLQSKVPYKKFAGDRNPMLGEKKIRSCGYIPFGARPTNLTKTRISVECFFNI